MNKQEKYKIDQIKDAISDIKVSKKYSENTIGYIESLKKYVLDNVKIDALKNIESEINGYKNKIESNNEKLDCVIKILNSNKINIENQAKEREKLEKQLKEQNKNK